MIFFTRSVGNGDDILFWTDRWLGMIPLKSIFPDLYVAESNKSASLALRFSHRSDGRARWRWDWSATTDLVQLSAQIFALESLLQHVSLNEGRDLWRWEGDPNGNFSVLSLRQTIEGLYYPSPGNKCFWNKWLPPRVNCFIWRVLLKRIPTRTNLCLRGLSFTTTTCPFCELDLETEEHLFYSCSFIKEVWKWLLNWCNLNEFHHSSFQQFFFGLLDCTSGAKEKKFLEAAAGTIIWFVWKYRNNLVFNRRRSSASMMVDEIQATLFTWLKYRAKCNSLIWSTWCCNPLILL